MVFETFLHGYSLSDAAFVADATTFVASFCFERDIALFRNALWVWDVGEEEFHCVRIFG